MRLVEANMPGWANQLPHYARLPQHVVAFYARAKGPKALGLDGSLHYAELGPNAPWPLSPSAVLASGRAGKIQVYIRPDHSPFSRSSSDVFEVRTPEGRSVSLPSGWGATSMRSLMGGSSRNPLEWRGVIEYSYMPLRNSIYSLLLKDLGQLDAVSLLSILENLGASATREQVFEPHP
jgi:hypothetical protein